jgi:hypothetical protein
LGSLLKHELATDDKVQLDRQIRVSQFTDSTLSSGLIGVLLSIIMTQLLLHLTVLQSGIYHHRKVVLQGFLGDNQMGIDGINGVLTPIPVFLIPTHLL